MSYFKNRKTFALQKENCRKFHKISLYIKSLHKVNIGFFILA